MKSTPTSCSANRVRHRNSGGSTMIKTCLGSSRRSVLPLHVFDLFNLLFVLSSMCCCEPYAESFYNNKCLILPDISLISAAVHERWCFEDLLLHAAPVSHRSPLQKQPIEERFQSFNRVQIWLQYSYSHINWDKIQISMIYRSLASQGKYSHQSFVSQTNSNQWHFFIIFIFTVHFDSRSL